MSIQQLPLVSVIINNYNYGRFVGYAIESALKQTYPNLEVIVVDDGSTDHSPQVLASFGDRIHAVLKENGGQTSALNAGFAASKGHWIYLLDSDDLFNPGKVQRTQDLAAAYPTVGMIAHDLEYCTGEGKPFNFAPPYLSELRLVDDRQLSRRGKLSASLPATSGLCLRRDVLEQMLPMPIEMRVATDNYVKWVALSLVPVLLVPELLGKQRIHGSNVGTIIAENGGMEARVRLATQSAIITYHMNREHPQLRKLAWKQYGRMLRGLRSSNSEEARQIERNIRARYSVVEPTNPVCLFYVVAAYLKAYAEDLIRSPADHDKRVTHSANS